MTLRDGRYIQDVIYEGGAYLTGTVWVGAKNERERGQPEWTAVPLSLAPDEWLRDIRAAVDEALRGAA